jgi:hypothetical protein
VINHTAGQNTFTTTNENASRSSERRADQSPDQADWDLEIKPHSRRTSSPIRPHLVFGTHSSADTALRDINQVVEAAREAGAFAVVRKPPTPGELL